MEWMSECVMRLSMVICMTCLYGCGAHATETANSDIPTSRTPTSTPPASEILNSGLPRSDNQTSASPLVGTQQMSSPPTTPPSVSLGTQGLSNKTGVDMSVDAEAFTAIDQAAFHAWKLSFQTKAVGAGVSSNFYESTMASVQLLPEVLTFDSKQPEFSKPIWAYLDIALSTERIEKGRQEESQWSKTLKELELKYQVDESVIMAIWGMESNFGQNKGKYPVVDALTTLSFAGRRQSFWQEQLIAALKIMQAKDTDKSHMLGSWAGAMGHTQFIPTTFLDFAVDQNGDGRRDLWDNPADALASTANYLSRSGWQYQKPWGYPVTLPANFEYQLADPEEKKTLREWQSMGVQVPQGVSDTSGSASLILPGGYRGQAFLVFANFKSIMRYNNSTAYALAIGLLGDAINGRTWSLHWPKDERGLSRNERIQIQMRLNDKGYAVGKADGIMGSQTRSAIRRFQMDHQLPADGFAGAQLLQALQ